MRRPAIIDTVYGRFHRASRRRLDFTYDYEAGTIRAFRRLAERAGATRMLDIGANVGVYTAYLSTLPGMARLDAFEPAPEAFAQLKENAALQPDPGRIHCHALALSDGEGRAAFASWGPMSGRNRLEVETRKGNPAPETIEVARATLDATLAGGAGLAGATFAAKIDVEGHEGAVVAGGRETLGAGRGLIQVESFGTRAAELREALAGLGYAWLGRMKDDHFFCNFGDEDLREALRAILWEESAAELDALKELRVMRRQTLKATRQVLETVRYAADPLRPDPDGPEEG